MSPSGSVGEVYEGPTMRNNFISRHELIRSKIAMERSIINEPPIAVEEAIRITLAGCERVRAFLAFPMHIHSGYRCEELNEAVGGSKNSQHKRGEAVDFTCPDFGDPREVAVALQPNLRILGIDQMILESTWVHLSITLEPRCEVLTWTRGRYIPGIV